MQTKSPPDADKTTVHIRCGSDIQSALQEAGFCGDFMKFADPYCQGPVPASGDLISIRADWISNAYDLHLDDVKAKLCQEQNRLDTVPASYDRIVLWFEHDSYDQLILARLLAFFSTSTGGHEVELICIDHYPGIDRFIGLGQLPPRALRGLWDRRAPVSQGQFALGEQVWAALGQPSPEAVQRIAKSGTEALPQMAPALHRHLRELPWTADGLSLTQRLVLRALDNGPRTAGEVFATLHNNSEPLPFLGDVMFWAVLGEMGQAAQLPFEIEPASAGAPWPQRRLFLTQFGWQLLHGNADWLAARPPPRWVGGIEIAPQRPVWRWDDKHDRGVLA
ncbi:MAG: DUF1835 domain-containing protein [Proteobacteria bacterium]|nr:DUF1835 domain-containing protein [Pseudomonadota bacterium]